MPGKNSIDTRQRCCEAGLIVARPMPQDGHRQHYLLCPGIPMTRTERGLEMDFDCCVVRLK